MILSEILDENVESVHSCRWMDSLPLWKPKQTGFNTCRILMKFYIQLKKSGCEYGKGLTGVRVFVIFS